MKYYVVSDVHGFYSELIEALTEKGFFSDTEPHQLIVLGDLMDRGRKAKEVEEFISDLLDKNMVILIRGNHEDLLQAFVERDHCVPHDYHIQNGTYGTALQLTGLDPISALNYLPLFASQIKDTVFYQKIMPAMIDYFETEHYVFVHGWLPCYHYSNRSGTHKLVDEWRYTSPKNWEAARWVNGMEAVKTANEPQKTVVCGHWHSSYGHANFEGKGTEFGKEADFSPYYADGIIAIDACTAASGKVNCIVLEDVPV